MINEEIVLYFPIAVVFGILLAMTLAYNKGKIRSGRGGRSIFFLTCALLWQVFSMLHVFAMDTSLEPYCYALEHISRWFMPVAFFYYAISFYRIQRYMPRWMPYALLGPVSLLSAIFLITGGNSIPYIIANIYVVVIYVVVGVIVVAMFRRLPAAYRRGSVFHIAYLAVLVVIEIAELAGPGNAAFDTQYFGITVCGLLFYCAHMLNSDTSSLSIDQSSIFNFLNQSIFILNEDGVIVETNRQAVLWLQSLRRKVENVDFDGLLAVLGNNNRILVKKLEDSSDSDIHFIGTAIPLIYRMERREFVMIDGITKGEFITLTDVSRNRLLIERLRDMAGVDALTGAANRYRYQDLLRKLDRNENYPLAVVIGDVNGLKSVNDIKGHLAGDQYLMDIAAVLMDCCPKGGYVARYGGDEFATLLVKTSPETVEEYIAEVNRALKIPRGDMQPSISLGYAIKHHGNENLSALIGQADQRMYAEKTARKAAEREALNNA